MLTLESKRSEGVINEVELNRLVAYGEVKGPCVDKFDDSAVALSSNIPV